MHFRQLYRGIPAFDNDLRVAIDRAGRVHSVAGSPRPDTERARSPTTTRSSTTFTVSRKTARKLKLRKRTIATFRRTFGGIVNRRVRLLLPRKVRAAARRAGLKTLRGTLTVTVRDSGGRSRRVKRAVRIRI